jgi:hypothetical protein
MGGAPTKLAGRKFLPGMPPRSLKLLLELVDDFLDRLKESRSLIDELLILAISAAVLSSNIDRGRWGLVETLKGLNELLFDRLIDGVGADSKAMS